MHLDGRPLERGLTGSVASWQAALVPYAEWVEVAASHVGLIFNRKTYTAIATALALPERSPPID